MKGKKEYGIKRSKLGMSKTPMIAKVKPKENFVKEGVGNTKFAVKPKR